VSEQVVSRPGSGSPESLSPESLSPESLSPESLSKWKRWAMLAVAIVVTAAAHQGIGDSTIQVDGERFIPNPERARFAALGFKSVVADYYWLQAVQLLGGARSNFSDLNVAIARLVDVTTTVNPWVDHPYRFAAVWLTDSEQSVRHANRLLERGVAYHPLDWRNRYYLGFNHFFYLDDAATAARVLSRAIGLPGAPKYLGALAARLQANEGNLETAAAFLIEMADNAPDGYARAEYLKALDEIDVERSARVLDDAREEYERRRGHDIERVADLTAGPHPVLSRLPPAHPHFPGFEWTLDDESGQIVSTFYGNRYRVYVHPLDAARHERWRLDREARSAEEGGRPSAGHGGARVGEGEV